MSGAWVLRCACVFSLVILVILGAWVLRRAKHLSTPCADASAARGTFPTLPSACIVRLKTLAHEWHSGTVRPRMVFFVFSWCPKTSKPKGIPLGLGKQPTEKSKTACLGFTSRGCCSQPHCAGSAGAHEQHPDDEPVAASRRRKTQALSKVFLVVRLKRPSSFCFSRSAWCLPFGCKLARCKFAPKRQAPTHPRKAERRPHF